MTKDNKNFNEALKLFDKVYTQEELIELLKNGTVIERQYAALNIKNVNSNQEAEIFISNIVGVDGKIREAVALKLEELTQKTPELFQQESIYPKFAAATIDIDSNVCRLAINSAQNIISDDKFSTYYANEMQNIIDTALEKISKFTFRDKKYKINKQIFKIYWCLEALINFHKYAEKKRFVKILTKCSELPEYTIREKCAKLIKILPKDNDLLEIRNRLLKDENYYVRNILNN